MLCMSISSMAQNLNLAWVQQPSEYIYDNLIGTDAANNVYSISNITDTVDFDPSLLQAYTLSPGGTKDGVICKLTSSGSLIWAKQIGGVGNSEVTISTTIIDSFNNLYIGGTFKGNVDFDMSPNMNSLSSTANSSDIFICKYDSAGVLIWVKTIGGSGLDNIYSISIDSSQHLYFTGTFVDTVDFDPGQGVSLQTGQPGFLCKWDSSGQFLNVKVFNFFMNAAANKMGEIYFVTNLAYTNNVDLDPGPGIYNVSAVGVHSNMFVCKLDTTFNMVWCNQYGYVGAMGGIGGGGIKVDDYNNFYINGFTKIPYANFSPGGGMETCFVAQYSQYGGLTWSRGITYNQNTQDASINFYIKNNNIYLFGYGTEGVSSPAGNGPIASPAFPPPCLYYFIARCNIPLGCQQNWSTMFHNITPSNPGPYYYALLTLCAGINGDVFCHGRFYGSSSLHDFDPGPGIFPLDGDNGYGLFLKLHQGGVAQQVSICNLPYVVNGVTINTPGLFTQVYQGIGGFDSSVSYNATPIHSYLYLFACDTLTYNGIPYTNTGLYTQYINSVTGCDTVLDLFVQIIPYSLSNINISTLACDSLSYAGVTYYTSGQYTQFISSPYCSDTNLTLNLTVNHSQFDTTYATSCINYNFNGITYNTSGVFYQYYAAANLCDSIKVLYLDVLQPTSSSIVQTACESLTINGLTYTNSGLYTQTFTNAVGCDSILYLYLTFTPPIQINIVDTACQSYTYNGITYTTSNIYYDTIQVLNGCDTNLTLNLTINYSHFDTTYISSCINYTFNGITYNTSGTFYQYYTGSNLCDSIKVLYLDILQPSSSTIIQTSDCSFTLNGQTYFNSGLHTQSFINAVGCDSVVYLYLTINPLVVNVTQSGTTLTVQNLNVGCQWVDCNNNFAPIPNETNPYFTPSINGSYAVIVSSNGCVDTSNCFTFNGVGFTEYSTQNIIQLYPNPTSNSITVSSTEYLQDATINVYDITGKLLQELPHQYGHKFNFDLSPYANGLYDIEIQNNGIKYNTKVLKE